MNVYFYLFRYDLDLVFYSYCSTNLFLLGRFKLANIREYHNSRELPHPYGKVVITSLKLRDPSHLVSLVTFHSVKAYPTDGSRLQQITHLQAHIKYPQPLSNSSFLSNYMSGPGYNTFHGPDTGPLPPGMSQPTYGTYPQQGVVAPQPQFFGYPGQAQPHPQAPTAPWQMYQPTPWTNFGPYYGSPNICYGGPINNEIPGVNLRNPSGGYGLPPGYDYLFPAENTVIHVFRPSTTKNPPWQQPMNPHDHNLFFKLFVPSQMTILELMGRLGLDNKDAKLNVIHEVVEKGNGHWAKGMSFKGDDKDRIKKKLKELGWDSSRIGVPGRKPVVWLYMTKK
jgi:hypothetical protein